MKKVILINNNDEETGEGEKFEVHQKGLLHRAFSIFIFNSKNELLIQKRHRNKYHSGGLWANTCCGHPEPKEKTVEAAKRRLKEEMSLDCLLTEVGLFYYNEKIGKMIENEIDHLFIGRTNEIPVPNPDEVDSYKWLEKNELIQIVKKNPKKFAIWFQLILKSDTIKLLY